MTTTTSPPRRLRAIALAVAVVALMAGGAVVSGATGTDPASATTSGTFEKIGEFRPFGVENAFPKPSASAVDSARRHWFLIGATGSAEGDDGQYVYVFDLDTMEQVGDPLSLGPVPEGMPVYGLDEATGHLIVATGSGPSGEVLEVEVAASGPRLVASWQFGSVLESDVPGVSLIPAGIDVYDGKLYVGADTGALSAATPQVRLLQLEISKLGGDDDPLDWHYDVENCFGLTRFNGQTAIGRSRFGPRVLLPCRPAGSVQVRPVAQGVTVVDLIGESAATFTDTIYPVGGKLGSAQTFFDRVTDRLVMRRTGPAQLFVFDGRHRSYLRPIGFGRGNLYQAGINPVTGRLYGHGDELRSGQTREFVYVPELRPTPAPNGLDVAFEGPSPDTNFAASGTLAIDPPTGRVFVADVDADEGPVQNGRPSYTRKGAFFHVYRDTRPALGEREAPDPDRDLISPAGEAQGYGAHLAWIGGAKGTSGNPAALSYQFEEALAGGSRQLTFARTLDLRISAGEAKARAIEWQPGGASAAETTRASQPWPHSEAACIDFGAAPTEGEAPRGGAVVTCDASERHATSTVTYEPGADDPFAAPVQEAWSIADTKVDPERGIVTTVTSQASFQIPGLLKIGRATATAETAAAGTAGSAASTYERSFADVSVLGTSICAASCDPHEMADRINAVFAEQNSESGTIVQVSVPKPDVERRASPGGAEAVVQRDFWEHEQDIALHETPEDRYELPAIEIVVYRDRSSPEHYVYWLAGVQAVSRFPVGYTFDQGGEPVTTGSTTTTLPTLGPATTVTPTGAAIPPETYEEVAGATLVSDAAPSPEVGSVGGPGLLPQIHDLARDLAWALRWPFSSPALMALWAFLGIPVFLASRRRLLLRRHAQLGGAA